MSGPSGPFPFTVPALQKSGKIRTCLCRVGKLVMLAHAYDVPAFPVHRTRRARQYLLLIPALGTNAVRAAATTEPAYNCPVRDRLTDRLSLPCIVRTSLSDRQHFA